MRRHFPHREDSSGQGACAMTNVVVSTPGSRVKADEPGTDSSVDPGATLSRRLKFIAAEHLVHCTGKA